MGRDYEKPQRVVMAIAEAAAILDVDEQTLLNLAAAGGLKVVRIGVRGLHRVPLAEVDRLLAGEPAAAK